jgi:hypothetical protein
MGAGPLLIPRAHVSWDLVVEVEKDAAADDAGWKEARHVCVSSQIQSGGGVQ